MLCLQLHGIRMWSRECFEAIPGIIVNAIHCGVRPLHIRYAILSPQDAGVDNDKRDMRQG